MSDFDRVKSALSIKDVICRETGFQVVKKHLEECPFCGGHACFSINDNKNFFKCFQCDEKGDVFNFLQRLRGIDAGDALTAAAAMAGIALEKKAGAKTTRLNKKDKVLVAAAEYYHQCMHRNGGKAWFTEERGHSLEVCDRMRVGITDGNLHEHLKLQGFSFEEMVSSGLVKVNNDGHGDKAFDFFKKGVAVFPHFSGGRVMHFTMKDPKKETKPYQLPADNRNKNWRFYNEDALKYDDIILVEGENDLLSVMDAGVYGVIGTSGQVQDVQIRALEHNKNKRLFLWMDNDEDPKKPYSKGKGYIRKICTALPHVKFKIIVYPDRFKDPDEFIQSINKPAEKRKAIEALKSESVEYLTWEIFQADKKPDLDGKLKHLEKFKVFQSIALESELQQQIYIEILEGLGFSQKGIKDQLEAESDIKKKLNIYMETLLKKSDADPIIISEMMFQHFKNKGRFFRTKKDEVFLLYKNKTYEISNNLPFNSLMMRTADMLPTREPGRSVWCALANRGYSYGVEIQAANWLFTDPQSDTIFVNLNSPDNTILKIGHDVQEIPNGINDDNVLLRASSSIESFSFVPDVDIRIGFKALHELFLNNLACEVEQRYLIAAWMISAFLFDFSNMQILMKFSGPQASGKTTAARMVSLLIYGTEDVGTQSSASAFSEASRNPLIIIDNLEQKNINMSMNDFLLLAASKSAKTKRAAGTDSETIKERPKSLVLTTAIEPFTLSELISRTCEIEFNQSFHSNQFSDSDITRELSQQRNLILSSILKVISEKIIPNIADRKDLLMVLRSEYKNHAMERNNEYLALLMLVLKQILPYMPYYDKKNVLAGVETGEAEIRRRWIEYQNERAKEMTSGSNAILKMLDGIVKDYLYEIKETGVQQVYDPELGCESFRYTHPDYGLDFVKTSPTDHFDKKTGEAYTQTHIMFTATATDIVYAFDAYCKKKGLKNIYSSAVIFGKRLENDLKVLKTENWTILTKEGIFPYFKIVCGRRYYRFVNILIG
jgi:DNA primase